MKILNLGGILILYFSLTNTILGYYLPPKRDINFMFIKSFLKAENKVSFISFSNLHNPVHLVVKEGRCLVHHGS